MNGPNHYTLAQGCLDEARDTWLQNNADRAVFLVSIAEVHARLADVAARAIGSDARETAAWREVAGTKLDQ